MFWGEAERNLSAIPDALSRSGVVTHFQRAWSPSFDG